MTEPAKPVRYQIVRHEDHDGAVYEFVLESPIPFTVEDVWIEPAPHRVTFKPDSHLGAVEP